MESPRKLLLIDGTAELFRSYYAFKDLRTKSGEPTGAAFGMVLALRRLLESIHPTHAAVAFDRPEPTFRHEAYPEYKATRKAPPEELIRQIPIVRECVAVLGLAAIDAPGFEADDIVATLVRLAREAGMAVVLSAADKDFLQLVGEGVTVLNPKKSAEPMDAVAATGVLGVPPTLIPDLLALMGDSSDNIPGVEGIGHKNASRLINRFGSLDEIYSHLSEIGNDRIRSNLESQRETAYLSLSLARMHADVPIQVGVEDLAIRLPNLDEGARLFERLEFASLARAFRSAQPRQGTLFENEG